MHLFIQPVTCNISYTIHAIKIQILNITLFQGATIYVTYFMENGEICPHHNLPNVVTLTPEEYQAWGENDQYLISQVLNKVGLVPIPPPVIEDLMEPDEPTPSD